MQIRQDPITKLWCRNDGAVLMPPSKGRFKTFRWTFGSKTSKGYKAVRFQGKNYFAHQMVCRAFNGSAPIGKPEVDHINRIKDDNRPENLRWVDRKENNDNRDYVDQAFGKYKVRECDDKDAYSRAYGKTYYELHREEIKARSKAHWVARYTKMKAQGLTRRKGPNGKYGWYPRVHKSEAA